MEQQGVGLDETVIVPPRAGNSFHTVLMVLLVVMVTAAYAYLNIRIYQLAVTSGRSASVVRPSAQLVQTDDRQNVQVLGEQATVPDPTPIPTPVPTLFTPGAPVTYRLSHGPNVKGPKPTEVTITPLEVLVGEHQKVVVSVRHDVPVTGANVILETDSKTKDYPLTLTSGTRTMGTWTAEWTSDDSHNRAYYLKLVLKSPTGDFSGGLTFR